METASRKKLLSAVGLCVKQRVYHRATPRTPLGAALATSRPCWGPTLAFAKLIPVCSQGWKHCHRGLPYSVLLWPSLV